MVQTFYLKVALKLLFDRLNMSNIPDYDLCHLLKTTEWDDHVEIWTNITLSHVL